ncbi:GxxExxY protein [Chloroflexus sp.]|uniref:GxxExxY protein n=1 Tax=Chloroflexus sp. TaxID=1904827 RepID=UPI00298EF7D5|nr:GxxExxY protein [Chloroflexus sp.]MCS6889441.1 GxxExxY protein [Chloroflexus sp.]MDW8404905.1 GxxExxY protein [Chloroflexus sp.]
MSNLVNDHLGGLTYTIIGIAMAVHNDLGPGHRETTYHRAMHQRLIDVGLAAEYEPDLPVIDERGNVVNFYRPDHRIEQVLLVEYKAHFYALTNDEIAQCFNYFAASDCSVCLLFNFGRRRLEWKRLFPPKHILSHRHHRRTS